MAKADTVETIAVSEFKRRCLELVEATRQGKEYVITKRGEPVARVVPYGPVDQPLRGLLRGQIQILGDIVEVDWSDEWEALR